MKLNKLLTIFCLMLFATSRVSSQAVPSQSPTLYIIKNVNVIDMKSPSIKPAMDVLIAGGRIADLQRAGKTKFSARAQIIDGTGQFLIPGLWDMHVHIWMAKPFFPLFIANGVTGVRDMGGVLEPWAKWEAESEAGNLVAPRAVAPGMILDGVQSAAQFFLNIKTEEEARETVRSLKKRGADFIKVYSMLSPEIYRAIADEAKKQNLVFAGHVPYEVGVEPASKAGQKSLEHLTGMVAACSSQEAELNRQMLSITEKIKTSPLDVRYKFYKEARAFEESGGRDSFDEKKAGQLAELLKRNKTYLTPTLTVLRGNAMRPNDDYLRDRKFKYFPAFLESLFFPQEERTVQSIAEENRVFQNDFKIVNFMHRHGVKILAGSDAPNPYVFSGFSLHDELSLLVQAGLTPFEALQTATVNPAEYLGKFNQVGTIEKGKFADLVLLAANPLENISNTQRIQAVIARGSFLSRQRLDEMLSAVDNKRRFNK